MRLYLVVLLLMVSFEAQSQIVFRVAYGDKGTPPYYNGDGKRVPMEKPGIVIELLNLIAKDLNLDLRYVRMPWKDVLSSLKENKVDAIFDASFNEKRLEIGHYPFDATGKPDGAKSLYSRNYVLFVNDKKAASWDGIQIISDERGIAAKEGFSILVDLEKQQVNTVPVLSRRIGFGLLKEGKVAGFADLEIEGVYFLDIHRERFRKINKLRHPLKTKDYFLMISHGFYEENKILAEKIWQKIPEKMKSTHMREIQRSYLGK